jgi:hypothetical protein
LNKVYFHEKRLLIETCANCKQNSGGIKFYNLPKPKRDFILKLFNFELPRFWTHEFIDENVKEKISDLLGMKQFNPEKIIFNYYGIPGKWSLCLINRDKYEFRNRDFYISIRKLKKTTKIMDFRYMVLKNLLFKELGKNCEVNDVERVINSCWTKSGRHMKKFVVGEDEEIS